MNCNSNCELIEPGRRRCRVIVTSARETCTVEIEIKSEKQSPGRFKIGRDSTVVETLAERIKLQCTRLRLKFSLLASLVSARISQRTENRWT